MDAIIFNKLSKLVDKTLNYPGNQEPCLIEVRDIFQKVISVPNLPADFPELVIALLNAKYISLNKISENPERFEEKLPEKIDSLFESMIDLAQH